MKIVLLFLFVCSTLRGVTQQCELSTRDANYPFPVKHGSIQWAPWKADLSDPSEILTILSLYPEVYATENGLVKGASRIGDEYLVVIKSLSGHFAYAELDTAFVKTGMQVKAGELIGLIKPADSAGYLLGFLMEPNPGFPKPFYMEQSAERPQLKNNDWY